MSPVSRQVQYTDFYHTVSVVTTVYDLRIGDVNDLRTGDVNDEEIGDYTGAAFDVAHVQKNVE